MIYKETLHERKNRARRAARWKVMFTLSLFLHFGKNGYKSLLLHFDIISLVHRKGTLWAPSGLSGESEDRPKRVVSDADVSVPHQ